VRKPPGSTMVTLMPTAPLRGDNTSEKPSTPHFARIGPRPGGPIFRPSTKTDKMTGFPLAKVRKSGLRHDDHPERFVSICARKSTSACLRRTRGLPSLRCDNTSSEPKAPIARLHCARCRGLVGTSSAKSLIWSPWRSDGHVETRCP